MNKEIQQLIETIQHNCHIADARHAGDYTLCVYLLKMREMYRWEQGIDFKTMLTTSDVGDWLTMREGVWDDIEAQEYKTLSINLESSVGQDKVCCCGGVWLGVTAWNGYSLSSSYNDGIRHHSCAIYTVATLTHRVKSEVIVNFLQISVLFLALSAQLRNLGSISNAMSRLIMT